MVLVVLVVRVVLVVLVVREVRVVRVVQVVLVVRICRTEICDDVMHQIAFKIISTKNELENVKSCVIIRLVQKIDDRSTVKSNHLVLRVCIKTDMIYDDNQNTQPSR